jgi:hypothetical protein
MEFTGPRLHLRRLSNMAIKFKLITRSPLKAPLEGPTAAALAAVLPRLAKHGRITYQALVRGQTVVPDCCSPDYTDLADLPEIEMYVDISEEVEAEDAARGIRRFLITIPPFEGMAISYHRTVVIHWTGTYQVQRNTW